MLTEVSVVRNASRQMVRLLGLLSSPSSAISISQCHILVELEKAGALTVGQCAALLEVDKSSASRAVQKLMKQKLVCESPQVADRRRKPHILTKPGREVLAGIHEKADDQVERALLTLSGSERAKVVEGLQLYAKALKRSQVLDAIEIRPIQAKDNQRLASIVRETMAEFGAGKPGTGFESDELNDLYLTYQSQGYCFFVAIQGESLLGGCGIAPLPGAASDGYCELQRMYLTQEGRGIGLGSRLLSICLDHAKTAGYTHCYLETMANMTRARRLYESFGFVQQKGRSGDTGHCECNTWYIKAL